MIRILVVNGSPHENRSCGNVARFIKRFAKGMQVDIFWLGEQVAQCDACRSCKRGGFCKTEDSVNNFVRIAGNYDGYLFVSPVYYASISSQMDAFLTRLFYSNPKLMMYKPVAGITVSRRSGNTSAFSRMNMYFLMHSMIVVGSQYWNELYSDETGDTKQDAEGMEAVASLVENMKYVIEGLSTVEKPMKRIHVHTNFIR